MNQDKFSRNLERFYSTYGPKAIKAFEKWMDAKNKELRRKGNVFWDYVEELDENSMQELLDTLVESARLVSCELGCEEGCVEKSKREKRIASCVRKEANKKGERNV